MLTGCTVSERRRPCAGHESSSGSFHGPQAGSRPVHGVTRYTASVERPSLPLQEPEWRRIHDRRVVYGTMGFLLWLAAVTVTVFGVVGVRAITAVHSDRERLGSVVGAVGLLLCLASVFCHAYGKGRHGAWTALGMLGAFGLPLASLLRSRCLHCGRLDRDRLPRCVACDAPL